MRTSAKHPALPQIDSWIEVEETCNKTSPLYCHLLIRPKDDVAPAVWDELFAYINHAHEGARQALRAPLEDSLHPLDHDTNVDPAFGYPHKLGGAALQGFFGEIIAGIIAENYVGDDEQEWDGLAMMDWPLGGTKMGKSLRGSPARPNAPEIIHRL